MLSILVKFSSRLVNEETILSLLQDVPWVDLKLSSSVLSQSSIDHRVEVRSVPTHLQFLVEYENRFYDATDACVTMKLEL